MEDYAWVLENLEAAEKRIELALGRSLPEHQAQIHNLLTATQLTISMIRKAAVERFGLSSSAGQ